MSQAATQAANRHSGAIWGANWSGMKVNELAMNMSGTDISGTDVSDVKVSCINVPNINAKEKTNGPHQQKRI